MTRYYKVPDTDLTRSTTTRDYTHAAVRLNDAGEPYAIITCSTSAEGALRNAKVVAPNSFAIGHVKVVELVRITAAEYRRLV